MIIIENVYDLLIVGAGPAGMTAAIYAKRAKLNTLMFEKSFPGGQVVNTYEVDNYPGLPNISGYELVDKMRSHAENLGIEIKTEEINAIDIHEPVKVIKTDKNEYKTKTLIIATGAKWKKLGVKGEKELTGLGVSYCATCDGAFYNGKTVAVIGGGDVAVEDAIFLSNLCKKVYLLHRRDELRAVKILQDKLFELENIEILWNTQVKEVIGENKVEKITVINTSTKDEYELEIDGLFVGIGTEPNINFFEDILDKDAQGYIITDVNCETNVKGIYAAGDVANKPLRQIVTAVSDGAVAVYSAERYIIENF